MNLIFGMKVIYLMRLDSLVKIVVERCTRNTTKVPTVWNINYQIIKNNNTTTQKKGIGVFFPDAFLILLFILCDEVILRFALFLVEADMQIIAIKKPIIGILYIIQNTIVFSLSDRRYWLIHIKPHGEPFMYLAAAVYFTKETNPFFA